MDFSALNEALAFKSYDKVANICDSLMFQAASEGVSFQEEWPYAIHLIGHIYVNDINSARFLWKKIPLAVKESQPEVSAAWKIGQRLWIKDYASVHEAIREFIWSPQCQGIMAAFSVSFSVLDNGKMSMALKLLKEMVGDCSLFADVVQHGWTVDPASRMLTVKKQAVVTKQKLDHSKLQRLTEYVFHLEH
ncbi:hypothetical protein SASPL_122264 [Salvia splendens]|uniref:CSN8/PSMD8/EIF3K domain-containing protein n=1 Tax=Salvia splendens TaxID=180675 RepID=A0A8X8XL00_SALSN|nr:hypothetical protein SASPL_122264 [Salvia splendens]